MGHIAYLRKQFKSINTYDYSITLFKRVRQLKKLQSPSPKDALCQVWLKLAQWFWRRFLNFDNVFSLFPNYLPLEKGGALHFNKLEAPSPKDDFYQVWLKLAQWFWRRRFSNFFNVFSQFPMWVKAGKCLRRLFWMRWKWTMNPRDCFLLIWELDIKLCQK